MAEASAGKDSVTGHWELMGLVLPRAFPTFPNGFPAETIAEFERRIGRKTLANKAASGTTILDELGAEHLRTGKPIVYTSADSVFQIAAHEEVIPVAELYRMCGIAFELVGRGLGVGPVIARPFVGTPGQFARTSNRRDFALDPIGVTLLDRLHAAGYPVVGIGKIEDLFGGRGLTKAIHTVSDQDGLDHIEAELTTTPRGLIFANLVDSDTLFGHRNDVAGYAANLERLDARLGRHRRASRARRRPRRHGRPRQRPVDAVDRSLARARAAAGRRAPPCVRASTSASARRLPISVRRSRICSAWTPLAHGTSFLGALGAARRRRTLQ